MQKIELNGKTYPVNFGTSAIIMLEQLTGIPFYKFIFSMFPKDAGGADEVAIGLSILENTGVGDMAKILFAGIYGGAKKEKKPQPFENFDDLLDALDDCEDLLTVLSSAFFYAVDSLPKEDKKKGAKVKPAAPEIIPQ